MGEKKWIVGGIQMLSTPNRTIPGVWIQGSCKPEPSENRLANLSPLGYRSSTPALLKGDPKRLRTGRLSCRISTTAGSDMKSLSWSTIELHRWRDPPGFIGAACLRSGGDIAFGYSGLDTERRKSNLQRDPHRGDHHGAAPWWFLPSSLLKSAQKCP